VVESGSANEVLRQPRHPYTKALLAAVPRVDGTRSEVPKLVGDMPSRQSSGAVIFIRVARWRMKAAVAAIRPRRCLRNARRALLQGGLGQAFESSSGDTQSMIDYLCARQDRSRPLGM